MIDASAVAWKEWRELIGQRGLSGKQGIILMAATFGIMLPLMNGRVWITSPAIAIAWSWVPMFLVTTVIADAFAGERERHTLETLLASRLSNASILFGKMGAAIGYAGVLTFVCLILGVLTVNLSHREEGLVLYTLPVVLAMCGLGLLGAVFVAAIGVLISLRAATVRQAQQTLGAAIIVLLLVPVGVAQALPAAWTQNLHLDAPRAAQLAILGLAAFAALDAAVVALAMSRFRRARLFAG
jgi:ABC-2 type transport system permease protein